MVEPSDHGWCILCLAFDAWFGALSGRARCLVFNLAARFVWAFHNRTWPDGAFRIGIVDLSIASLILRLGWLLSLHLASPFRLSQDFGQSVHLVLGH